MGNIIFPQESFAIIGAAMEVHNILGDGFKEEVYQEALSIEFSDRGIPFIPKKEVSIYYKGHQLKKTYNPDFLCYDNIIVEIKAISTLVNECRSQTINYLRATKLKLGLLINFGESRLIYERFVNENK